MQGIMSQPENVVMLISAISVSSNTIFLEFWKPNISNGGMHYFRRPSLGTD